MSEAGTAVVDTGSVVVVDVLVDEVVVGRELDVDADCVSSSRVTTRTTATIAATASSEPTTVAMTIVRRRRCC